VGTPRVLQVVATTDLDDATDAALTLHHAFVERGDEVRTFALGPGRRADLQMVLPTLGPVARAMASRNQLRREAPWAGVVLAWGPVAVGAALAVRRRGGPPVVGVFGSEVRDWVGGGAPRAVARTSALLAAVVRTDLADGEPPGPFPSGLDVPEERMVALTVAVDTPTIDRWRDLLAGAAG
jgi:hypothetical protein